MKKLSNIKIAGLSLPLYTALVIILAVVIAMGKLPLNMVGITFMLVVLGHLFYFLGERLPFWNTYLGGWVSLYLAVSRNLSFNRVDSKISCLSHF